MIRVEKIIPGGYGLANAEDGKKIFLWNALPGEEVAEYNITKNKSKYTEAVATKIVTTSPHRVAPKDDCFLSTSPWQIMSYDYELNEKRSLITELFREHGINIDTPDIITDGRDYHYRNKMEYALYYDNDTRKINLAFHARGSHRKIPITSSSIERPELFTRATEIIDDLNARREEARKYQSLLLRTDASGHVSGGLYENHRPHPRFPTLTDEILGHTFSYSPNGFFQINLPVYGLALKEIAKHITSTDVLDLYSGVGTIGLSVAGNRRLTLVESDKSAYAELEINAASFPSATPIYDKSENALDYIKENQTVILDPPRAGCAPALVGRLNEVCPREIIYLSCNPATQARDISHLLPYYKIASITTFNFFPRTPHIENLVILRKLS